MLISCSGQAGIEANHTEQFVVPITQIHLSSTPISSATPRPTIKPTSPLLSAEPSSTVDPATYNFPQWLIDRSNSVFMTITDVSGNTSQLSFFNAATGERYDLQIENSGGYFWVNGGRSVGLLSHDGISLRLINLDANSRYSDTVVFDGATRFLSFDITYGPPKPLILSRKFGAYTDSFILFYWYWDQNLAYDGQYIAYESTHALAGLGPLTVENLQTEEIFQIKKSDNRVNILDYMWSPTNDYLAVLQTEEEPQQFQVGQYLEIYEASTGKMISSFGGTELRNIQWSPDGLQVLYLEGALPCIRQLNSDVPNCFLQIEHQGLIRWTPDGQSISYIDGSGDRMSGGLCVFNLKTQQSNCLTEDIPELAGQTIVSYKTSPDGNYFAAQYDESCPACDYRVHPSTIVMAADGGYYFLLGEEKEARETKGSPEHNQSLHYSNLEYPYTSLLWRPTPQP